VILRCTKKLLDQLGAGGIPRVEPLPSDEDWYLNLLWIERKKCLLLTHSGTLFSVFRPAVRQSELRQIGPLVTKMIAAELRAEDLPGETFGALDPSAVSLAKTVSRSTLGFMNEMAAHIRYHLAHVGGLDHCDISQVNRELRRTLHNRGEYVVPIELVARRLSTG
jgi:hypothetical protein